jgi:hypothetical protein
MALVGIVLAGCDRPPDGGVRGRAVVAPACPVDDPASPCPETPFVGTVVIVDTASGDEVARVDTDEDGRFEVRLEPGSYAASGSPQDGVVGGEPVPFEVAGGRFTEITVGFDTGIRAPT